MRRLRVLFVCAEYAPLAKAGGLADMTAGLSRYLARCGHDVRVLLPHYGGGDENAILPRKLETSAIDLQLGGVDSRLRYWRDDSAGADPIVYRFFCPELFAKPEIYAGDAADGPRFTALSDAASRLPLALAWTPDIVHCHDWQTALVPVLLQASDARFGHAPRTVLTLHNLGYQGVVGRDLLDVPGLRVEDTMQADTVNLLALGIRTADALTTVSPTYAKEIQTQEYGMGLHDLLAEHSDKLRGIINGVDYSRWNPWTDQRLVAPYSIEHLEGKQANKEALCQVLGLESTAEAPLIGLVSRLVSHKGIDLVLQALPGLLEARSFSCAFLGDGEKHYVDGLHELAARFPGRVSFTAGYDESLARRILAGCDIFLMPSIYEPCGLTQLYALRYGAVPVVRATGGLADTIQHFDPHSQRGNGCVFEHADANGLKWGLGQALDWFADAGLRHQLRLNAMRTDFSWDRQGPLYENLYAIVTSIGWTPRDHAAGPACPSSRAPRRFR